MCVLTILFVSCAGVFFGGKGEGRKLSQKGNKRKLNRIFLFCFEEK